MGKRILILNSRPGMRRGGVVHPARAEHPLDAFTPEQLAAIQAEPAFAVSILDDEPTVEAVPAAGKPRPKAG